jgi:glutaredoxin
MKRDSAFSRPWTKLVLAAAAVAVALVSVVGAAETERRNDAATGEKASSEYVVVLKDGTVLPSRSKPLSAFGSFRFVDVTGRTRVLRVDAVDLEATRAANADVPPDPDRGTLSIGGGVTFDPSAMPETVETPGDQAPAAAQSVTVYSATWCGYCRELKRFLAANEIPATVIEVDLLPPERQGSARATMKRLTGRVAYPTVIIGGEAKVGFSASWIQSKLEG